MERITL
jgi:hypothetical protein